MLVRALQVEKILVQRAEVGAFGTESLMKNAHLARTRMKLIRSHHGTIGGLMPMLIMRNIGTIPDPRGLGK